MTSTEEIKTKSPVSTNILRIYNQKLVSSDEAVKHIKSGDNVIGFGFFVEIEFRRLFLVVC